MSAHVVDSTSRGAQPADSTRRPVDAVSVFRSVLCAVERSANAQAAWRHAALLASPGGVVEAVSEPQLIRHGQRALIHGSKGHDLLVVGAGVASHAAVLNAPIPILVARRCPLGTEVTDTILVPIEEKPQSSHAVVLAGRLAAGHSGTVTILPAPPHDPSFQRAIAAGGRVLLQATGVAARVLGNQLPPERSIPRGRLDHGGAGQSTLALDTVRDVRTPRRAVTRGHRKRDPHVPPSARRLRWFVTRAARIGRGR
jgi:hypothetical protein